MSFDYKESFDFEIENKYNTDNDDLDSLIIQTKENNKEKELGIKQQELREKIERFSLNTEENSFVSDLKSNNNSQKENKEDQKVKNQIKNNSQIQNSLQKNKRKNRRKKEDESIVWYTKVSKWPVFFIVLYSFLILFRNYLASISSNLTNFAKSIYWFDNLRWLFEIFVFLIISYIIVRKEKQLPRIAGIAGALIGFSSGVIIAVIKLFWYREIWNIFYLSAESIFLAGSGLVFCLAAAALFYEKSED